MRDPYVALLKFFSWLPWRLIHALGWGVGMLFWALAGKRRRVAKLNLELCLPDFSEAERRRLSRVSFVEGGRFLAECGKVWLGDYKSLEKRVDATELQDMVAKVLKEGKGLIVATPHIGNWEVAGLYCGAHFPITSLYEPQKGVVDQVIKDSRERTGATLVAADMRGVRAALAALRNNELVGILPDQEVNGGGVFADFFGVPAMTMTVISKLSAKTGCPLYIAWAERLPWGRGFKLRVMPADPGYDDRDPVIAATALNKSIERCVRKLPNQYWWSYERFRRRPDSGLTLYEIHELDRQKK